MSPDLAELHPAARPWFTDRDLLLRAVHDGPLSTTVPDVSALHQALTRGVEGVTGGPWEVPLTPWGTGDPTTGSIAGADEHPVFCAADGSSGLADFQTAMWVAAVRTEAPALLAAVRAVLEPHWPVQVAVAYPNTSYMIPGFPPRWMCAGCLEESLEDCEPGWPCTTVATLLRTLREHL